MEINLFTLPNEILEVIIEYSDPKLPLMCSSPLLFKLGTRYLYRKLLLREGTERPKLLREAIMALSKNPIHALAVRDITLVPKTHDHTISSLGDPMLRPEAAITDDLTTYLESSGYGRGLGSKWQNWFEQYQEDPEYQHAFLMSLFLLLMPNLNRLSFTVDGRSGPFNDMLEVIDGSDAAAGPHILGRLKAVRVVGNKRLKADLGFLLHFFRPSSIEMLLGAQLSSGRPQYMMNFELPLRAPNITYLILDDVQIHMHYLNQMLVACSRLQIFELSWSFRQRRMGCEVTRFDSLELYQALLSVSETLKALGLAFEFRENPQWSYADAPDLSPMPSFCTFQALKCLKGSLWLIFSCNQDAPISSITDKMPPNLEELIITEYACRIEERTFTIPNLFHRLLKVVESHSGLKKITVLLKDKEMIKEMVKEDVLALVSLIELAASRGVKLQIKRLFALEQIA